MSAGARTRTIEPLRANDLVTVAQCIAIDAGAFPYASAQFGLRSACRYVWVAREGGDSRVLGFVAGHARHGVLHLEGLAVDEGVRRSGIGRGLVREAVARARQSGMRAVALHVSVANRAGIALYHAEGFVVERRLRDFYPRAAFDGVVDAYAMVLLFDT